MPSTTARPTTTRSSVSSRRPTVLPVAAVLTVAGVVVFGGPVVAACVGKGAALRVSTVEAAVGAGTNVRRGRGIDAGGVAEWK